MRSTALFLFVSLFLVGCGSVLNRSSVSYKAPVLEPGHGLDHKGRVRCAIRRTGTEMTVAMNGTSSDVAHGFNTMNGGSFINSGVYLYNCALAEMAGTSVGGGSDEEALAIATETKNAFEDYLVEKSKEGGGQSSDAGPAPTGNESTAPRSGIIGGIFNLFGSSPSVQPAPTIPLAPQATPAPTPAPAQSSALAPSPAPVANLCQGINSSGSFAELAGVYERLVSATTDPATRAIFQAKVGILQTEANKTNQDQQLFQTIRNAMSAEEVCR